MAKVIKYGDTSGIESDFKQAPVGLYGAKVESIEQKDSKNTGDPMVEVVFVLTKDADGKKLKQQYGRLWYYAPLDPDANWARRLKDLITAFGLKSKGGNLAAIEGKECLVRLREDTDLNGDYRPVIGKVMKAQEVDEEDEEEEEEETSDDGELDDLSRDELKALIKERSLEIKVLRSMSDDDIRSAIAEQLEDEDEEDEEDEEEAESDNYDEMSIAELRQELDDRELESKGAKKILIARLRTDDVEEPV